MSIAHKKLSGVMCPVDLGKVAPFGEYSNAFRVFLDNDGEVLLDFCVYSARENKALCLARIRVPSNFLVDIHERIGRSLEKKQEATNPAPVFLFRRPEHDEDDN